MKMMINRTIPFRPKLEGAFRKRFYDTVVQITKANIDELITRELRWVEDECDYNFQQRRKYRAVWFLLRDLIRASWSASFQSGVLELSMPILEENELHGNDAIAAKKMQLREWFRESRLERLTTFKKFVEYMEDENTQNRRPIRRLIADGAELAARLQNAEDIEQVVLPRLELVRENERDTGITNHKLSDIWRYFRLTWATPSETTPGRTMQYLIRDYAHPDHPVMGIISLENCAVQITKRDAFIGWNAPAFIADLKAKSPCEAKETFYFLLSCLEEGIRGIDYKELSIGADKVNRPDENTIATLLQEATFQEEMRQSFLKQDDEDTEEETERSELGNISLDTETALYKRKRAEQLARFLSAKLEITRLVESSNFDGEWGQFISPNNEKGYSAVRNALMAQKSRHIGTSMLELNVCGAIPPYNEILGGKLAALLALSPQVVKDYRERYGNKKSEIASRLKNEDVIRPADLVYIGTTSLYYVGSSQYNRLKLPAGVLQNERDIKWEKLGKTVGFGTLHISKATTAALVEAAEHIGFTRINHVFGEGASPKLRLLNLSIRELLETSADDSTDLAKHTMSRIVYGVCLARNTKEYLLGHAVAPEYYFEDTGMGIGQGTENIIRYWIHRWLVSRLRYGPLFERLSAFNRNKLTVSAEILSDWTYKPLKAKEEVDMNIEGVQERLGIDFVRSLYRGSSAYADNLQASYLNKIHIKTKLDDAVVNAVKDRKDVILTGSPGDGKTHIIRVIKSQLDKLENHPIIELDASCLSNEEIYSLWVKARELHNPFVLAINAAVFFSLSEMYKDFEPLKNAWLQMTKAVVYNENTVVANNDIIVFDLSRRDVLSSDIVAQVIEKITADEFYTECMTCPNKSSCPVHPYRDLMRLPLFQERLGELFAIVALKGEHISLRELLSFFSYLLFGDRTCTELNATLGDDRYSLLFLIFNGGKGQAFNYIQNSFDPAKVTHPIWDERLLSAQVKDNWVDIIGKTQIDITEAIESSNISRFDLRKRCFFFFNSDGHALLDICDDEVNVFRRFLCQDEKTCIKELITKLNAFFGIKRMRTELDIRNGHRFNSAPRKVLISATKLKASQFSIGKPTLLSSMQKGIDVRTNYIHFQRKDNPIVFLRIDLEIYHLLVEAERGVPMLFIENEVTKRVWRFIEQLQDIDFVPDDELTITLLDIDEKKELCVTIDMEDKRYISIEQHRVQL